LKRGKRGKFGGNVERVGNLGRPDARCCTDLASGQRSWFERGGECSGPRRDQCRERRDRLRTADLQPVAQIVPER
ncbi:hypothetical protein, partial [Ochrobactrum sp. POC9]|uniref:hypothetical protein n=1 Tax=Ochrobactrum sp. POC9 TaxID=2203419 RepID=UPI001AED0D88